MSEVWIAPIFAILGTVLGVSIPSISRYFENKWIHKKEEKEKHANVTRKLLTGFIPRVESIDYMTSNYLSVKSRNKATMNLLSTVIRTVEDCMEVFEKEIKDHYPLEMHSNITKLVSDIHWYRIFLDIENYSDNDTNIEIVECVRKINDSRQEIVAKIEKRYI